MKNLFTLEKLKYVAAGAIVLTAFGIMLQSIIGFAFSLARVGTVVLISVAVSALVALGWQFITGKRAASGGEQSAQGSDT